MLGGEGVGANPSLPDISAVGCQSFQNSNIPSFHLSHWNIFMKSGHFLGRNDFARGKYENDNCKSQEERFGGMHLFKTIIDHLHIS